MDFPGDERSQSVIIGSLLLFGFLIISLSSYQAFVIPQENEQVEFDHNQEVQSQMQDLRSSLIRTGGMGTQQSTSVDLGTTYPSRTILLNPAPPIGTLQTIDDQSVVVQNASASGETGDYWDGSDRTFATNPIRYRPGYNVYDNAPRSNIEHNIFYNRFEDGTVITKSSQPLISGRSLSLTLVDGNYSKSESGSVSVDTEPVSTSANRVPVTADGGPVTIQFETQLNNETWTELLKEEYVSNGGHIQNQSFTVGTPNTLTLKLESGVTYNLRVAKVGVGSDISEPSTTYLTDIEGDGTAVPEGGEQKLTAEIRDEFDNPLSGIETCADVTRGPGTIEGTPTVDISDQSGEVSFTYQAPNDTPTTRTAEVTVSYRCDGSDNPEPSAPDNESATFEITVNDGSGSSGGGGGGGGGNAPTVSITNVNENLGGSDQYDVTADAGDVDGDLTEIRFELRDSTGTTVDDSGPISISGSSATESQTLKATGGDIDSEYDIVVTVTDSKGNIDTDQRTVSGSG